MREPPNASRERFVLRWHSSDPNDTVRPLLDLGGRVPTIHEGSSPTGLLVSFPPVVIEVVPAADPRRAEWFEWVADAGVGSPGDDGMSSVDAVTAASAASVDATAPTAATLRRASTTATAPTPGGSALALGWATVDASRAEHAFPEVAFRPAANDVALGARARAGRWGGIELLLLEPATEGRLAAALARHGEGPVALYVAALPPMPVSGGLPRRSAPARSVDAVPARLAGREVFLPAVSPVHGAVRLVRPSRPSGPFLFVVDRGERSDAP
jgi:hypothetical protein